MKNRQEMKESIEDMQAEKEIRGYVNYFLALEGGIFCSK